jgi:hypothetical protein
MAASRFHCWLHSRRDEKQLEDGGRALGFFNLGSEPANLEFNQLASIGFTGAQHVRDLWRQSNLPDVDAATGVLKMTIPVHGVVLCKLISTAARKLK